MLGNAQNPLDALLGDLVGCVGARFFILEFKRDRSGFKLEVSDGGKPHRKKLYDHLRKDQYCRELARCGHFGAYLSDSYQLTVEPYAYTPAVLSYELELDRPLASTHELDYWNLKFSLPEFFDHLSVVDDTLEHDGALKFDTGLGLTKNGFAAYVRCMYQHLETNPTESGVAGLLIVDPETKKAGIAFDGFETLVSKVHGFFQKIREVDKPAVRTSPIQTHSPRYDSPSL